MAKWDIKRKPSKPPEPENCGQCKYIELIVNSDLQGLCRRFPVKQRKNLTDWCGEWSN